MMMMMPGLSEEECERYRELLEIKCQYDRRNSKQRREGDNTVQEEKEAEEVEKEEKVEGEGDGDGEEASSSVVDANCNEALSHHEMALIEEELRHLEFKCRNILRAQKMQQLRERCLKAWMMEEETVVGGAGGAGGRTGPLEAGNQ